VRCGTLFRISSIKKLCIEWFFIEAEVTLLSVQVAAIPLLWSSKFGSCSSDFRIAICSAWLLEQQFCS
jgi:hypothetical protein